MQSAPNIVRERLKARPPDGNHPDADVLTAFAERSLPELERAVVLEHVARCGDCRDVIALALPETEAALPVPTPVRTPWLTWPALRWGLVAAGIVLVAAFGLFQFQRRSEPSSFVAKQSLPEAVAPTSRTEAAASTNQTVREQIERGKDSPGELSDDSLSTGRAKAMLVAPKAALNSQPPPPSLATGAAAHGAVGGTAGSALGRYVQGGPRLPAQWQQAGPARVQVSVPAAPSAVAQQQSQNPVANNLPAVSETVEVQASAPQMETEEASTSTRQAQSSGQQSTAGQTSDESAFKVDKAKAATASSAETVQITSSAPRVSMAAPAARMETVIPDARAVPPRWTITAAGGLQRSFDQGNSWQTVDVNAAPLLSANAASLESVENSRALKRAQKQEKKRSKVAAATPAPVFRAVAATGMQVWAGGLSGMLYHSVDAGTQWIRVVPVSGETALTGDIVALDFSDAQHGKITTSSAEVWSTADAGQTWQKQ